MLAQTLFASCLVGLVLVAGLHARLCTVGTNICLATLVNGSNFDASYAGTAQSLLAANPGSGPALFVCNLDASITFNKYCKNVCTDGGVGKSDYCDNEKPCPYGENACLTTLVNGTNFDPNYATVTQSLLAANPGSGPALFTCSASGVLSFNKRCSNQCVDGGVDKSDYCDNAKPCPYGENLCLSTLVNGTNFDPAYADITQNLLAANPGSGDALFTCGLSGAITFNKRCSSKCVDGGVGISDYCDNAKPCPKGEYVCLTALVNGTNFDPAYADITKSLLAANPAPAGAGSPIFYCGQFGVIQFGQYCPGACVETGVETTDFCADSGSNVAANNNGNNNNGNGGSGSYYG